MSTVEALCSAISKGDLAQIRQLIEIEHVDPNGIHSLYGTRPIDFAGQSGSLEVVRYLFAKGANLCIQKNQKDTRSFLYWTCSCQDVNKRKKILEWLLEDKRYLSLEDGITETHLQAALDNKYELQNKQEHGGLLPIHYAAMSGNKHVVNESTEALNEAIIKGNFVGITPIWLMAKYNSNKLEELAEQGKLLHLNTGPTDKSNPDIGISIAWLLAGHQKYEVLEKLAKQSKLIDLDAAPTHESHINKGTSIAWQLAFHKRFELLEKLAPPSESINLDAAPTNESNVYKDLSLAWLLANSDPHKLLEKLAKQSELIDLDTTPTHESRVEKGISVAWHLAFYKRFESLEKLAPLSRSINLNTAPTDESNVNKGASLAFELVIFKQWELLEKLIPQSEPIDLDARPTHEAHPHKGTTLLQYLITEKKYNLLKKSLEKQFEYGDAEKAEKQLEEIIKRCPEEKQLLDWANFIRLQQDHRSLLITLQNSPIKVKQDMLRDFSSRVKIFDKDSDYYCDTQRLNAAVLLEVRQSSELTTWAVAELLAEEVKEFWMGANLTDEQKILLLANKSYVAGGDTELGSRILASIFNEQQSKIVEQKKVIERLQQEIKTLKGNPSSEPTKLAGDLLFFSPPSSSSTSTDELPTSAPARQHRIDL